MRNSTLITRICKHILQMYETLGKLNNRINIMIDSSIILIIHTSAITSNITDFFCYFQSPSHCLSKHNWHSPNNFCSPINSLNVESAVSAQKTKHFNKVILHNLHLWASKHVCWCIQRFFTAWISIF